MGLRFAPRRRRLRLRSREWGHLRPSLQYVTVDQEAGRELFYVLVESSRRPSDDPLVLWMNG